MIAIDTNVLIRVLVDDPDAPDQCEQARELLLTHGLAWIAQIVLVETVWVLESVYGFGRAEILNIIERIRENPALELEAADRLDEALALYRDSTADFADSLILVAATQRRLILHTFDRKLGRLNGAQRIVPT
ncbi:MAG TPA: type II toxin-antitoxin system VapC family toxin [Candidatus Contendobacter sp.]|nr:type II toxin-antitoxin system VapC family toxin [Candidatus Contendobacter sp.]HRZ52909.1 type II toxin-antitoxin system VapC family toxin [Candidatus Contendobacter sp.]